MTIYIDEFLYRGRPPGSADDPAWHIALRSAVIDDFGRASASAPLLLNMQQAREQGWDLPEIIAAINADLFVEAESQRRAIEAQSRELDALQANLAAKTAEASAHTIALAERIAAIARLTEERDQARAALKAKTLQPTPER